MRVLTWNELIATWDWLRK